MSKAREVFADLRSVDANAVLRFLETLAHQTDDTLQGAAARLLLSAISDAIAPIVETSLIQPLFQPALPLRNSTWVV